jgi:hypothetical protein
MPVRATESLKLRAVAQLAPTERAVAFAHGSELRFASVNLQCKRVSCPGSQITRFDARKLYHLGSLADHLS